MDPIEGDWENEGGSVVSGSFVKHDGDVYYDPRTNQFLQLRERHKDHLVFGNFTDCYGDAQTNIPQQDLPLEYLDGLKKVERIEDLEEAEYNEVILGWRVIGERLEPSTVES